MKKIHLTAYAFVFLLSMMAFYQCTNDDGLYNPNNGGDQYTFENFAELHDSISSDTIKFQITDPSSDTTLTGEKGIRLVFPANSCSIGSGGTAVAPYTVELIEIFKRGEMIAQNIQTYSDHDPLVSGGMFWVRVTDSNGAELLLNGVQAILPKQTDATGYETSMQYFTGNNQTAPSGPVLSWGPGNSDLSFDEEAGANGEYTIWSIMGGWSNCDAFYNLTDSGATQFKVKVSNALDYTNTKVFFALNDFSTVAALTTIDGDALKTYEESIPMGASGKLIAISLIDDKLYFASQEVTIAGNDSFEMEVQEGTVAQLETLLATLD